MQTEKLPPSAERLSEEYWSNFRQLIQDYHETIEKLEHLAGQVAEDHFSATSRTRYVSTGFNSNVDGWTVAITIKCDRNDKPQFAPKVCPACQQKSLQP